MIKVEEAGIPRDASDLPAQEVEESESTPPDSDVKLARFRATEVIYPSLGRIAEELGYDK